MINEALYPENPIIFVDDENLFLQSIAFFLKSEGISNIITLTSGVDLLDVIKQRNPLMIALDMIMPDISGEVLLKSIKENYEDIPVVIVTAIDKTETIVESIKNGAYDYLVKPLDETRLLMIIRHIVEFERVKKLSQSLSNQISNNYEKISDAFSSIVTKNEKMLSIFKYIEAISTTPLPILITGDTGTGKELIAASIHRLSCRSGAFVRLNVAGEDPNLISDTLYGHSKGGFTGAVANRKGLIEQADNGTMFLDEIGDLNIENQVKLLHVLQERKYYQIGSDVEKYSNARFIFATNKNILQLVDSGKFRKDLYYRIKFHHIHLPTLRERKDDIPLLVKHFVTKASLILNKKEPRLPDEIYSLLSNYSFPGNIRELEGIIFDAVSRYEKGTLSLAEMKNNLDFKESGDNEQYIYRMTKKKDNSIDIDGGFPTIDDVTKQLIDKALQDSDGNQTIAAKLLGISRKALNNRLIRASRK